MFHSRLDTHRLPTLCHQIQLLYQERLILCPSKIEGLGGHELGNAIFFKLAFIRQLRHSMETAELRARKTDG